MEFRKELSQFITHIATDENISLLTIYEFYYK